MECDRYRAALSAHLDAEDIGLDPQLLAGHLASCSACRNWEHDAVRLGRAVRVSSVDPIPNLTPTILAAIGREPARGGLDRNALRGALGAVAAIQVAFAVSAFLSGVNGVTGHLAREMGSFDLALAVGFFFAAWKPTRAAGMLPIVGALVATMALTTVVDLTDGAAAGAAESAHLLEVVGLGLLWLLARGTAGVTGLGRRLVGA